jgi:hypothetical protein
MLSVFFSRHPIARKMGYRFECTLAPYDDAEFDMIIDAPRGIAAALGRLPLEAEPPPPPPPPPPPVPPPVEPEVIPEKPKEKKVIRLFNNFRWKWPPVEIKFAPWWKQFAKEVLPDLAVQLLIVYLVVAGLWKTGSWVVNKIF